LSAPDPSLGPEIVAQHQHRTSVHQHLRTGPLLPTARLVAHQRYAGSVSTFRVQFDHLLPGAGWMRIVADLSGALGAEDGLFRVEADDQVTVDEGLKHLFLRHGTTPLLVLMASLRSLMVVDLHRLSRSFIGPFWFPGCIPEAAPDVLQDALALHLFQEIVGQDVRHSAHRDPWVPPTVGVQAPQGYGLFRERRLAVPRGRVQAVQHWADGRGGAVVLGF
jgi:hypothetical protein